MTRSAIVDRRSGHGGGSVPAHQHPVDLAHHLDNIGTTTASATGSGGFNVWANSFGAEQFPPAGSDVVVEGVAFRMPPFGGGRPDNVRCVGQYIAVEAGRYDWLYVLGAGERRVEDTVALHFADASVDFEPLRLSDFWAAPPAFGETLAFATLMHYPHHVQFGVEARVWCQRVPVVRRTDLAGVRLPRNIAAHLFAATLVGPARSADDLVTTVSGMGGYR